MSVSVDICRDVEKYKETVIGGFDLKQSLSLIGGLLCGGITGAVSVFVFHVPMMFVTYIIMAVAVPFMLIGFANKDGMGFFERIRRKKLLKQCGPAVFVSTESEEVFALLKNQEEEKNTEEKDSGMDFDLYMAKMKKILLFGVPAFVLVVIIAVIILFVVIK